MTTIDMINRLVNMYRLLERDEKLFKDEEHPKLKEALVALRNQKFGVRMAAQSLGVWDEVIEIVEQERLTEDKT